MDEKIKLTGLARFSPRLNLLKRFAGSDNPILSISAKYLLRNRTARRIGGTFEFIFLVILPVGLILLVASFFWWTLYDINSSHYEASDLTFEIYLSGSTIFSLIGLILGLIISLLPGNMLRKTEREGALLRLFHLNHHTEFKNMVKFQMVSFFLPIFTSIVIGYSIMILSEYFLHYIFQPNYTLIDALEVMNDFTLFFSAILIFAMYISILSISASLNHMAMWASIVWLFVGIAVYLIVSFTTFVLITDIMGLLRVEYPSLLVTGFIIINILLIGIAADKARAAFRRCILPEK